MNPVRFLLAIALSIACSASVIARDNPRLVVVISIDQFPYEYLQRFGPYFSEGGFNRFIKRGANYTNAYYPYATTFTGPGHASIGSGLAPYRNGIIANVWYDRIANDDEYCVDDPGVEPSEGKTPGSSPINLAEESLGDRLKEKYPAAKVYGVAIKDRSAILMAGRKADAAYWFDKDLPAFISSSYYNFSDDVLRFNARVSDLVATRPVWELSNLISPEAMKKLTFDETPVHKYKADRFDLGVTFPHPIKTANAFLYTPFGNDLLLDFADHLLITERLGRDDSPDVLFIGLSSPDYLGHLFGPDSKEVADTVVRTDRSIEDFLKKLDARFGKEYIAVISADHGVQSIPEIAMAMGRKAGRVDFAAPLKAKTIGEFQPQRAELELAIAKKLKVKLTRQSPESDRLIRFFEEPALYINWDRVTALKLDREKVKNAVREAVLQVEGVHEAYTNSELMTTKRSPSADEQALRLSFRPDRSGDVLMTLREGYIWSFAAQGTNHGQPVERDQHVPVMFWGAGVTPGTYTERVTPLDIAQTIGALVGFTAGEKDAKALGCCRAAARSRDDRTD